MRGQGKSVRIREGRAVGEPKERKWKMGTASLGKQNDKEFQSPTSQATVKMVFRVILPMPLFPKKHMCTHIFCSRSGQHPLSHIQSKELSFTIPKHSASFYFYNNISKLLNTSHFRNPLGDVPS